MNWHVRAAATAVLLGTAWVSRAAEPMTFAEISLRVRMGEAPQSIVQDTAQRKLVAPLTGEQEAALQKAGVSPEWIAALRAPALLATPEAAAAFRQRKEQQAQATPVVVPAASVAQPNSTPPAVTNEHAHETDRVKVGDVAPDFTAKAIGGREFSLGAQKGRVTLVTIFTLDSDPCMKELTAIERWVWAKFRDNGLSVVALGSGADLRQIIEFKEKNAFTFDLVEDPQKKITALYATNYAPRCYVVSKGGIVKFASIGLNKNDFLRMVNVIGSELNLTAK